MDATQRPRILPHGRRVVARCDVNYFAGLITTYDSVQRSRPYPVVAFDLGVSEAQHAVAKVRERLHIMNLPDDEPQSCHAVPPPPPRSIINLTGLPSYFVSLGHRAQYPVRPFGLRPNRS